MTIQEDLLYEVELMELMKKIFKILNDREKEFFINYLNSICHYKLRKSIKTEVS